MSEITWKDFYVPSAHPHGPGWAEMHGMAYEDYLKAAAKESYQKYLVNESPVPVAAMKTVCTGGRGKHKTAFLGWVRVSQYKDGNYAIGMSETGNSSNGQNASGLQGGGQKMQGNLWPIKDENGNYCPDTTGESYMFRCRRCARHIKISPNKLGQAVHTLKKAGVKQFDISALPFG